MGWTFIPGKTGPQLVDDLKQVRPGATLLAWQCKPTGKGKGVLWTAVDAGPDVPADVPRRLICCYLLERDHEGVWGYKALDETCGPTALSVPYSMLQLVPDPKLGYSTEWRAKVQERIDEDAKERMRAMEYEAETYGYGAFSTRWD